MLFDRLCFDIKNEIMNKLARRELYYLSITSKSYHKIIDFTQIIINSIIGRLRMELDEHYDHFILLMSKNGAFLSGSFIIQCILDEYWESDIDIFCPHIGNKVTNLYNEPIELERNSNYYTNELEDYLYYNMGYKGHIEAYKYHQLNKHHPINYKIIHVRDYFKPDNDKSIIQMISLNIEKEIKQYYDFIEKRFDFDICKNMYNGQLYINNIEGILTKVTRFKCTTRLEQSIERYHKYVERGFVFDNDNTLTYNDLRDADYCKQRIFATEIPDRPLAPESLLNFIKVKPISHNRSIYDGKYPLKAKCYKPQCLIHFRDKTIKHKHYTGGSHFPRKHHIFKIILINLILFCR